MKFKGNEIMLEWELHGDKYVVTYAQWDMGNKYKLYRSKLFVSSFDSITAAKRYCGLR